MKEFAKKALIYVMVALVRMAALLLKLAVLIIALIVITAIDKLFKGRFNR